MASAAKRHKPNTPPAEESDLASAVTSAISGAHSFLLRHDHLLPPSQSLLLESLLSSAALSLRRLSLPLPLPPPLPPSPSPSPSWFLRLPPSSPLWSLSFRLSHPSFLRLLSLLPLPLPSDPSLLAAALLRLAHAAPYSSLSRRFSPSLPSPSLACRAFFSAVKSLSDHPHLFLPPIPSPGPTSLPHCRGFLSASRFGPSAISVQALISPDGTFLDVSAGWPATLKPDAILHQTRLYLSVEDSIADPIPHYVMGDPRFPLLPWLLTPYRSRLGPAEALFNAKHREAMQVARRAFARLRRRWRILDREWKGESLEFLPFVVVACCLLHNFVEACGEGKDEYEYEDEGEEEEEEAEGFGVFEGEVSEEGERVRDAVAAHLSQVCD